MWTVLLDGQYLGVTEPTLDGAITRAKRIAWRHLRYGPITVNIYNDGGATFDFIYG